jgi:hypothetical protein
MAAQNEVQSKERAVLERHQNEACASSIKGYMRSLFLLAIIGIIGFGYMLYAHPTLIFTQRSARLVDRRIMTIYPVALHIKCNLPHFFDSYAIVTPEHHVGNSHRIGQGRDGAVARSRSHIDSPGLEARGGSRLGKSLQDDYIRLIRNGRTLVLRLCCIVSTAGTRLRVVARFGGRDGRCDSCGLDDLDHHGSSVGWCRCWYNECETATRGTASSTPARNHRVSTTSVSRSGDQRRQGGGTRRQRR